MTCEKLLTYELYLSLAVVTVKNSNLSSATPFKETFADFRRTLKNAVQDMQVRCFSSANDQGRGAF